MVPGLIMPSTKDLKIHTVMYRDDGVVPNNPALPVVVLRAAVPHGSSASNINARMATNGWGGNWTYTVFDFHHYHPNAHEALIVASGSAEIQLGGPNGDIFEVHSGDALVLPAGVGHCRKSASHDFAICGGYPAGQEDYEIVRATPENRRDAVDRIAAVPLPTSDPFQGHDGPVLQVWQSASTLATEGQNHAT